MDLTTLTTCDQPVELREIPNSDLSYMLERWAVEHHDVRLVQVPIVSEAINRLRQSAGMSNADYLTLAAVTAKPTPDGIRIPHNLVNKIENLLMDFRDTALQLEALKKTIFYGDEPADSAMCRHLSDEQAQTLHAVLGMVGETAEMVDCFSNNMDGANRESLVKELGDHRWYEAILLRLVGITQEEIHEKNIAKLKARYGDKFNAVAALARVDVNPHIGSDFDTMSAEDDILGEVTEGALAKVAGHCTKEGCFVHDGESCADGEMQPEDCANFVTEDPLGR